MSALDDLNRFRQMLVAVRRNCAVEGLRNPTDIGQWGQSIAQVQERIEAVDTAIEDEAKLAAATPAA
jgi:hypothetical protein